MLKKIKIRYYFRKLKRKRIDIQTVAIKLSAPVQQVRKEYEKYIDPFNTMKTDYIFSFLAICVSVLSLLFSAATLKEMEYEREFSYKPDLRVYENVISLYCDENGIETKRVDDYTRQYRDDEENRLYSVYLNIDNIGTGNARDITYDWNFEENLEILNTYLDQSNVEAYFVDDMIEVYHENTRFVDYVMEDVDMESYISQGMQKRLTIPAVYMDLMTAYCYTKLLSSSEIEYNKPLTMQDFPKLYLSISYKDLQGKETRKRVKIGFEPVTYDKPVRGDGFCSLRIRNLGEEIL